MQQTDRVIHGLRYGLLQLFALNCQELQPSLMRTIKHLVTLFGRGEIVIKAKQLRSTNVLCIDR